MSKAKTESRIGTTASPEACYDLTASEDEDAGGNAEGVAPQNNVPANNQPGNNVPVNNQPENNQPENNQPLNNGTANNQPANNQPANNQPDNNQPANNQPANNEPVNNQPANNDAAAPQNKPAAGAQEGGASNSKPRRRRPKIFGECGIEMRDYNSDDSAGELVSGEDMKLSKDTYFELTDLEIIGVGRLVVRRNRKRPTTGISKNDMIYVIAERSKTKRSHPRAANQRIDDSDSD
ncbi:uncharacterized protein LOC142986319 [Anticarsia gemmatalis]|uniref:uncharacterized protein LOC142986319 n=1 Tax=Anticarsia gemmatalis TaxID=129554 RepID=UPI003F7776F2